MSLRLASERRQVNIWKLRHTVIEFDADVSDGVLRVVHVARPDGQKTAHDETEQTYPPRQISVEGRTKANYWKRNEQEDQRQTLGFKLPIHRITIDSSEIAGRP
jgi:hypothetical protein